MQSGDEQKSKSAKRHGPVCSITLVHAGENADATRYTHEIMQHLLVEYSQDIALRGRDG